jgi:hypothetical protein
MRFRSKQTFAGGRYEAILEACGELCDLQKPITPGPFLGQVKAKVCRNETEQEEILKNYQTTLNSIF